MHSQNNEEQIILDYFAQVADDYTGKLLDIGAYDGKTFSNTYALLERGWYGVLVEASPTVFPHLVNNVKHLDVRLVNACITLDQPELVKFWDNGGAVATVNQANKELWETKTSFDEIYMMSTSVDRLIRRFGIGFDLVNIDVEGGSVDLFKTLVTRMPDVLMWIVEYDGRAEECIAFMKGWDVLTQNGENIIFAK